MTCFQYLAAGMIPGKLPVPCADLSFLSIRQNFNDTDENLAALCLLRSSPNLQELELLVSVLSSVPSHLTTSLQINIMSAPKYSGVWRGNCLIGGVFSI